MNILCSVWHVENIKVDTYCNSSCMISAFTCSNWTIYALQIQKTAVSVRAQTQVQRFKLLRQLDPVLICPVVRVRQKSWTCCSWNPSWFTCDTPNVSSHHTELNSRPLICSAWPLKASKVIILSQAQPKQQQSLLTSGKKPRTVLDLMREGWSPKLCLPRGFFSRTFLTLWKFCFRCWDFRLFVYYS